MKSFMQKIFNIVNNRYLILTVITILISILFIFTLFNLQIIEGETYRKTSETRMVRSETITASRGKVYDRNGIALATNVLSCDVKIYNVKAEVEEKNDAIAKLVTILKSNGDKVYSSFPINEEMTGFNFSTKEAEDKWKEEMELDTSMDFDKIIEYYIEKYDLSKYSYDKALQIDMIKIKYEGNLYAYSLFSGVTIAKDISEESIAKIEEQKNTLYGVTTSKVSKRYYPYSNLFSHVVGYVGKISSSDYKEKKDEGYTINSIVGSSGIEHSYEKYLKGTDGKVQYEIDSKGTVSTEKVTQEAIAGNDVTLTVDYRLQKVADEALETCIKGLRDGTLIKDRIVEDASAGAVVVLDVQTGEVLAMSNYPNYNTNLFVNGIESDDWNAIINDPLKPMLNRSISEHYSPGSTFKMLVGIAGLENGAITVDEKILDTGVYQYGHKPKCWIYSQYGRTHGYVNVANAIKGSCNCFFYEVGRRIGISEIIKYCKIFGLGQKTGIELAQEDTGKIAGEGIDEWYLGQTLSAAIGQAESVFTPIQIANYISAIANGGRLNKVSLIKSIDNESSGKSVPLSELEEYSKKYTGVEFEERNLDIKEEYMNAIKEGMLSVTNETGGTTYTVFKNSNIKVAGKTGTSQVSSGSNNGIFVGFAPYDNPKIAVVAVIEHGGDGTYTARVVEPIMEEYFNMTQQDKQNERQQNVVKNGVIF